MKKQILSLLFFILLFAGLSTAAESVVYLTTLSTSHTHTGMRQTQSGLFYQTVGDTSWNLLGRPNNRVYDVDIYKPSKGKIIALATHTGVHQSRDGGKTWKVTSDWRMTEVNCIRIHPDNPDIIYASTPYGFYKTLDNGKTWIRYNQGLDNVDATYVSRIILDKKSPDSIFISTEDGVYHSSDDGITWTHTGINVRNIRTIVQHPDKPDILMAGTEENGLYVSLDHGKHWQRRDTGLLQDTIYGITFDPSHPDTVYAGGFQTGIYKSIDGGKIWKQYFDGLTDLDIHAIAVDPNDSNIVYAGSVESGVYRSTDGGETWNFAGIKGGYVWSAYIYTWEE
ncbi:hypothetical protein GF407_18795 [candidate division KSB1 bacterium]|nr:hypothetical protein [candidate division KSB1 bacterium]